MTLIDAIPFDGVSIGSDTWRTFQQGFLAPMRTAVSDDGLIYSPVDNGFKVTQRAAGATMSVDVSAGAAWANGLAAWSDEAVNLPIAAAHATYARFDYVVVRADFVTKEARVTVKQGTPAAVPTPPVLDKSAAPYYEVPLALVTVGAAVVTIVTAAIEDRREFINSAPGVMRMVKNVSGYTLLPGSLVAWNEYSPTEVRYTTTPSDPNTAGVIASIIPNDGVGLMTVQGVGLVKLKDPLGPGTRVGSSNAAGQAQENALNYIATLLELGASGQTVRCWVDMTQLKHPTISLTNANYEQTTLDNFAYVNGLSTTFTMRRPGKVMLTFRGKIAANTHLGYVHFALRVDGQTVPVHRQLWVQNNFTLTFMHIFDGIHAGAHTAGVQWKKQDDGAATIGYLDGTIYPTTLQIEVL